MLFYLTPKRRILSGILTFKKIIYQVLASCVIEWLNTLLTLLPTIIITTKNIENELFKE